MITFVMETKCDMTHFFCLRNESAELEIKNIGLFYFLDLAGVNHNYVEDLSCLLLQTMYSKYQGPMNSNKIIFVLI